MDDSDSMFSDDSDTEIFTNEFLNSIPEDSDEEEYSFEAIENFNDDLSTLTLILWHLLLGNLHMTILNDGHSNKVFFLFGKEDVQPENVDDQLRLNELEVD